jgi:hypothetical protein
MGIASTVEGAILWFDPRREHSSVPTAVLAAAARRACQGWPRLRGHPLGLGLDRPEHGGRLDWSGLAAAGIWTAAIQTVAVRAAGNGLGANARAE